MIHNQKPITVVGILNVTPDSFSDGGLYLDPDAAVQRAEELMQDGADLIDIGADSTRPGSECVGVKEELKRLSPVLSRLSREMPFSVDTHHAEVASFAIERGASMINDISSGSDPRMFEVVAKSNARVVLMYSRCPSPHHFSDAPAGDPISVIKNFLLEKVDRALAAGVRKSQIILDPGMGGFLSADPQVSWEVIERFAEFQTLEIPLMLGVSRKGFLKTPRERSPSDRDQVSALITHRVFLKLGGAAPLFLRVHNPKIHREIFSDGEGSEKTEEAIES